MTGYDCENTTRTLDIEIAGSCTLQEMYQPNTEQRLILIQNNPVLKRDGYSCEKIISTFDVFCGAFSHQKMAEIPKIEVREKVSIAECKNWIGRRKVVSTQGVTTVLEMDTENIIYSTPIGEFGTSNHNIQCEGQSVKIRGKVVDNLVELQQVKIILKTEKFRWKGYVGESQTEHIRFPPSCHIGADGCATSGRTYVWETPKETCTLEKVRDVSGKMQGNIFLDEKALIRLEVGQPFTSNILGCPELELYKTQYPNLFAIRADDLMTELPTVSETGIDIEEYINARDDYLAAELENRILETHKMQATGSCERMIQHHATQDQLIPIEGQEGVFGRMRGEVLSLVHCYKRTVQPNEMGTKCYVELPVTYNRKVYFLEASSRRMKRYGTEQPCDPIAASQFKTNENLWITLTPKLHVVTPPQVTKLAELNITKHIDMSKGGIFTHQQLQQWELSASFPDYHQALSRRLSSQACMEEGCIRKHVDMSGEVRGIMKDMMMDWHIGDRILTVLRTIGQITSIIVALIWMGQIIIRLVLCGQVCTVDGVQPACGLCKLFFTKDQLLIREYHQMKKTEDEAIPMTGPETQ